MFQLRSHLATLHNGINSVRIGILSNINQVSVISSQKLKPASLNPSDLKLLLTKLDSQLVSLPRLALPQWEGNTIWYMYKFMKLWSFMLSDTLYVVLYIPLVDKSLQFNLYRIHSIPLVHLILKWSFKYSIQEEYLVIRSESQYISFPLDIDIMACQVSNGQFCHISSPLYVADTSNSCSYALFLKERGKINDFYILSVINQTQDEVININDNFWMTSTLQDNKKLYITYLQYSYSIKLCFLYDIIYLPNGCDANAITFVLPYNSKLNVEPPIKTTEYKLGCNRSYLKLN